MIQFYIASMSTKPMQRINIYYIISLQKDKYYFLNLPAYYSVSYFYIRLNFDLLCKTHQLQHLQHQPYL